MRSALAAIGDKRRSEMRVAASLTIAEFLLPRWLGELHGLNAEVHPRLYVVNSERVAELIRARSADVGFIETATRPTDLHHKVVGSDRLSVVVRADHPWARRSAPVPAFQLADALRILREPESGTRSTFERALGREPRLAMEAGSTTALVGAALAGVGPAVVSGRAVVAEIQTGRLVEVRTDLSLVRPLVAIWLEDRRMSPAVTSLLRIAALRSASGH